MNQVQLQRQKRTVRMAYIGMIAGILVLLVVGIYGICWQLQLVLTLNGEPASMLEYGETYQEPGVEARLVGRFLWKSGIPVDTPIQITGNVDSTCLGTHRISYEARYGLWAAQAQREIFVADTVPPVITLTPDSQGTAVPLGMQYRDAGYAAWDNCDGDITDRVVCTDEEGIRWYAVTDSSGNVTYASREIPYLPPVLPEIHLADGDEISARVGTLFSYPAFTAESGTGLDLTDAVEVSGEIDFFLPGDYCLSYSVTDELGQTTQAQQVVHMEAAPQEKTVMPQGRTIYLTFDDGPGIYTEKLLDVLDAYNVKATFFVVNTGNDELIREIAARGHSIGIHTMSHDYKTIYASPKDFYQDLLGMQEIIYEDTGIKTYLMRFPGGSSNTISHFNPGIMTVLTKSVQAAGFRYFDWNVDSNDAGGAKTAAQVLENVKKGASKEQYSVVLQHDIHGFSVDAVESILQWGLQNGYTFLPLDMTSPTVHHGVNN